MMVTGSQLPSKKSQNRKKKKDSSRRMSSTQQDEGEATSETTKRTMDNATQESQDQDRALKHLVASFQSQKHLLIFKG